MTSMNDSSSPLSRRRFVQNSSLITLSLVGSASLASCSVEKQTETPEVEPFSGTPTPIVDESRLPTGEAGSITVEDTDLLLYRETDDMVHAYSAVCPHEGCIVAVIKQTSHDDLLQCPCHSSRFDLTSGDVLGGPADRGLTRHPATVADGQIVVEL